MKRVVEKLEGTISDLNDQLQAKEKIIAEQMKIIETTQKQMYKSDALLKDQKIEIDKISKDLTMLNQRYRKLSEENGQLRDGMEESKKEVKSKSNDLKVIIGRVENLNCIAMVFFRFLRKSCIL